ncbi:MAG: hypothetical protein HY340_04035 [Candidatus Kerfeldbacteria bacterium]|nr:hypothetical protein [Candidatus Kerfeldbacteria bacterium]
MKKLLVLILGAAVLEILAMEVDIMNLPQSASIPLGIIAALLLLAAFWEKAKPDERDRMLTWRSSHIAFLSVSTVLAGILAYQTMNHEIQFWLIVALAALVLGKLFGRLWGGRVS